MRGFIILDFGSQYTQLIARRLRELGHYSEIHPYHLKIEEIRKKNPYGIILSGGPSSVYEKENPQRSIKELQELCPVMGICYGMQLIASEFGGRVHKSDHAEYGLKSVKWNKPITGVQEEQKVWMSHGDVVDIVPEGFEVIGISDSNLIAAMIGPKIFAVQFHPEVAHTENGNSLLTYFSQVMCSAPANWKAAAFKESIIETIKNKIAPDEHVLLGLSGGVDSSVVAKLLSVALGESRVHCVFVNNGLLRKNEYEEVLQGYHGIGLNVIGVDAVNEFLSALKGIVDPELKRKTIGKLFIDIFEKNLPEGVNIKWLAQGTLYPDVIESISSVGGSVTIKSHHNVGGLPEKMKLKLIEPVRELFKDEVRDLGVQLGLPAAMLWRHPFPGPGLSVRILGEITEEKLLILREADAIFISELKKNGLYNKIWQAFCVLLPVKTVGVQGDSRSYANVLSLRAVTSVDGMTADWYCFENQFLKEVSNQITNQVKGINRVVYDITSKPPATIEWE